MATATIKIEFDYVQTIREAFTEAIRIANILQCYVSFDFNNIVCTAEPDMLIQDALKEYLKKVKKPIIN